MSQKEEKIVSPFLSAFRFQFKNINFVFQIIVAAFAKFEFKTCCDTLFTRALNCVFEVIRLATEY